MSTTSAGVWERKEVSLSDLGITGDKFRNILFQGSKIDSQIFYFDKIKLIKSSYIDNGLCYEINNKNNQETFINSYLYYILFIELLLLL